MNFTCLSYAIPNQDDDSDEEHLSTGSANVDEILGGGICRGELTEVFGDQASGKTQLGLSLCRVESKNCNVLLIDVEGSVDIERLREMDVEEDAVHILRMCDADRILACLPRLLPKILRDIGDIRLLILDSISFLSKACTMDYSIKRCQVFAARLGHLASQFNCAVVLLNDAKADLDTPAAVPTTKDSPAIPTSSMGEQWRHVCPTRIALVSDRYGRRHAVLVKSERETLGHTVFEIGKLGIHDPH